MKWIELGDIDYKIIIPLIYPIFYQIRRFFHKDDKKALFEFFTNFCGYLFSGIIYLIIQFRMKRLSSKTIEEKQINNKDDNNNNINNNNKEIQKQENELTTPYIRNSTITNLGQNQIQLEKKKRYKKKFIRKYLFVLLLVIIYFIPMFLDSLTNLDGEAGFGTSSSISLFFCIFSSIFFSRIFLGEKIYSHQIFSSIIIGISISIVMILFLIKKEQEENMWKKILVIIFVSSLYSLFNTLEKHYYSRYIGSPYHLMFVIGLFAIILTAIYEFCYDLISGIDAEFNGIIYQFKLNFQEFGSLYFIIFLSDILSAFIWLWGIQFTVYFFTPCHFIISESISQIISNFINQVFKYYSIAEQVIIYFLFIIIIFATLIYNEIIIINFSFLKVQTKKYINLRQLTETQELLIMIDEDDIIEVHE